MDVRVQIKPMDLTPPIHPALTLRSSQQEAVNAAHGELQHWQAEARAQQEAREEEVAGLQAELMAAQSRLQQSRFTIGHLRSDLEYTQRQHKLAEEQACQRESHIWALEAELNRLKADLQEAENRAGDTETRLQPLSQSLELYRTKYQACLSKLAQQDSTLQALQEDVREARAQLVEREEQVMCLRGQAVTLQGELKAQAGQLEHGEEALSAASHRLCDTQTELASSRKHSQECELVTGTLRETNARLRQQVEEQKESMVKIQADFSVYRASHIHSNSDYECQLSNIQESQQAREQCAQGVQELSVYQAEVCQLRDEVSRLNRLKDSCLAEVLLLREAGEQLQAVVLLEGRCRQQEAAALEQKVARLEQDLEAAHSQTTDREQAVQKRDGLLRQSEADLLRARDAVRRGAAEAERQAAAARSLEAELQRCGTESQQIEAQCGLPLAQLLQRTQELKEARDCCRDTAQKLARQEERALLLQGGQQQAQEQLAQRVAEVVKAEQAQRKLQAELQRLKEKLHTTEHELQSYRCLTGQEKRDGSILTSTLPKVFCSLSRWGHSEHARHLPIGIREDLDPDGASEESRQAQLGCQQEAHSHKQQVLQLEGELRQSRETLKTSQQNSQEQAEACILLRVELSQEQERQQAQQARMTSSREREIKLEAEREQLQTSLTSAHRQLKEQERTAGSLQECVSELQSAIQRQQEEQMVQLRQCKAELGNREAQSQKHSLEALHSELESVEQKYNVAAAEVEVLRQSLGGARSDSSRLHKESELVLSSVNRLVQEHKQANEKLALKIKEQSKIIIHLTAEKDHLQESAEGLQIEVRRLKAELDEKRIEVERFQQPESPEQPAHRCLKSPAPLRCASGPRWALLLMQQQRISATHSISQTRDSPLHTAMFTTPLLMHPV
ncbi:polyamine-modulated factor 1-binding protein 1 [Centroberyx affinis]|uniref:polyamine-modulated factor 1-binding protein 1 n=1 Tax=Centroberyx affinis TaxID=166261 RepID=UPI003A5C4FA8